MARHKVKISLLAAAFCGLFYYLLGQFLFSSYYDAQWGVSASGMHSPPFGVYYPKRAAQVGVVSALLGFAQGYLGAWWYLAKR